MISLCRLVLLGAALVIVLATLARAQDIEAGTVDELIQALRSPSREVRVAAALACVQCASNARPSRAPP